ncbi:hypothetical protein ACU8V3_11460 [Cobetia marina]
MTDQAVPLVAGQGLQLLLELADDLLLHHLLQADQIHVAGHRRDLLEMLAVVPAGMLQIPAGNHRIRLAGGRSAQQHGDCQRRHHPSDNPLKPRAIRGLPAARVLADATRAAVAGDI